LLPQVLDQGQDFEVAAFSESADEVGGDYYDTLKLNEHQTALIIADVSGKGTTAAFHMSQMKGIFHSLAQGCIDPNEFMLRANQALIHCLERGSFISAIFFLIDTQQKQIKYARAGHCPILYYNKEEDQANYLKDKGVALGMVRNKSYQEFIQQKEIIYKPGDVMLLFTDGITEAKNQRNEQFGNDRLAEVLYEFKTESPKKIQEHLIKRLYEFSGTDNIDDDYTTLIVRFKN
jgi:serine phosphatase RsbU (regulator of sigma subunit)